MGDFESALAVYHRGRKLRPNVANFRLGIQKAEETLERTVRGKPTGVIHHLKKDKEYLEKWDQGPKERPQERPT